jgi:hypothetical protein
MSGTVVNCVVCTVESSVWECGGPCGRRLYCGQRCADDHHADHAVDCVSFIGVGVTLDAPATAYATQLITQGWVTIPVYNTAVEQRAIRASFVTTLNSMPEYTQDVATGSLPLYKRDKLYVKGGFGALANPSSFHNKWVVDRRMDAMKVVAPVMNKIRFMEAAAFEDPSKGPDRKLEQIPDRMRVLTRRATVQREAWHQDLTPAQYQQAGDSIFGGWINTDNAPQYFSAFPGSHIVDPITRRTYVQLKRERREAQHQKKSRTSDGFATKTKPEIVALNGLKQGVVNAMGEDTRRAADGSGGWLIEVPVGHILVFYQEMVHEVVGGNRVRPAPAYRLFTAFRLTRSDARFMAELSPHFFSRFAVPPLKSAQAPTMYSDTGNWRGAASGSRGLQTWSTTVWRRELLTTRTKASGKDVGSTYTVVPQKMYSLLEASVKIQAHQLLEDYNTGGFLDHSEVEKLRDPEVRGVLAVIAGEDPHMWDGMYVDDPDWLTEYALTRYGHRSVLIRNLYTGDDVAILSPGTQWRFRGGVFKFE